jgi:hypothetical protein
MNKSSITKKGYDTPCVEVVELHIQNAILEGSPMEGVGEGGEHPWG